MITDGVNFDNLPKHILKIFSVSIKLHNINSG